MRFKIMPPRGGDRSNGALTTGEVIVVLVVVLVAASLALLGMPVVGVGEFIAGVLVVAVRAVKGMRVGQPTPAEGI
jgi:hypothetical protein